MRVYLTILSLLFFQSIWSQTELSVTLSQSNQGQAASNVLVSITNTDLGLAQTQQSNNQGRVVFRGLTATDGYSISIGENDSFFSDKIENIALRANAANEVQLTLASKNASSIKEVNVVGNRSARINTQNAEVAFQLKQKEIQELPIEGRDITRVLFRLPNVSQATGFYPEAPNVSINGANSLFTSYQIDGMDNNERFLGGQKFAMPVGFTQNISVLTNNYSAEYGLTNNGVVNITSKSGSNEYKGEVFFINRPGAALDASSPYAQRDLSGNAVKDGFQRYQAGFGFGGAIKKDKTFYYVNAEHTTDVKDNLLSSSGLGVNETVRGTNRFSFLSGKIDQHWSDKWKSSLRGNLGIVAVERQGGGLTGGVSFPSSANFQDRNSALLHASNTFLGSNYTVQTDVQYSSFRWNYGRALNESSPQVVVLDPQEQTLAILGHPGYVFDATENTIQAKQKAKFYFDKHTYNIGVGVISAQHGLLGGGNVNGNYTVKLTEQQLTDLKNKRLGAAFAPSDLPSDVEVLNYSVELRPASFGARQTIFSAYMEDEWSATSRLNIVLGFRYDVDNLSKGGSDKADLNNIAPRINANYRLNSRSSIRGGYGVFYDKVLYAIYSDALQQNTTSADYKAQIQEFVRLGVLPTSTDVDKVTYNGNLGGFAQGVPYLNGPSYTELQGQREGVFSNERRILNPNGYQNPYTNQATIGYQVQLNDHTLFYADLVVNESYGLYRLRNLNAAAPFTPDLNGQTTRSAAEADATRPIPISGSAATINGQTLTGVARNVMITENGGRSSYRALSLNFQRERTEFDKYSFRLNYTLGRLENDTEDINFRAMDSNNFKAEWGPSINDRTHILNSIFNFYPTDKFTITVASLLQSGQPINRIPDAILFGTTDLNGDGGSFGDAYVGNSDRWPGESRNSDRLPWSNVFDIAAHYKFSMGKAGLLELRADIFNLFNATNLSGYSNNATQSNQIQVGSAASGLLVRKNAGAPRQFQFGMRYLW